MANNRRPQAPKRRNFVAKNVGKFNRPQTYRDRTKYDRYEDYLQDQLDDMIDDSSDEDIKKGKFVAAIAGEEYDPDSRKNYEEWLDNLSLAELKKMQDDMLTEVTKNIREAIDQEILDGLETRISDRMDEEYYYEYDY